MAKKKNKPQKTSRENYALDEKMKHFSEEVDKLAERFGRRMEKKDEEWNSWFHRTFGIVGPFIASIFGLLVFVLIIWAVGFVNLPMGSGFLSDLYTFLVENVVMFFLIFLFFSYTSYFSKTFYREYILFSPIIAAFGIIIGFWIAMHALNIASVHITDALISSIFSYIAGYIEKSIFWIFGIVLIVGYIALGIRKARYRPTKEAIKTQRITMRKERFDTRKTQRIYRSGKDKILGGVCGGIAEYLGVDPVLIRLLWIVATFAWGFGLVLYIIAWIIIPRNPNHKWD